MSIRTPKQVLAAIRAKARAKTFIGVGDCQMNAHNIYLIGGGAATAAAAFAAAKFKHGPNEKPTPGAFVFWSGGKTISHITGKPAGHVGIYSPSGWPFSRAYFWSPGAPGTQADAGIWKRMKMADLAKGWPGHTYLGWTEDINGDRVPGLAPKIKPPKPKPIGIGVWNTFVGNSSANVSSGLNALKAKGAEVILLQECYNKHQSLAAWCDDNGYVLVHHRPDKPSKPGYTSEAADSAVLIRRSSTTSVKRRRLIKAGPVWQGPNSEWHDSRKIANARVTFTENRGAGVFFSVHAPLGGQKNAARGKFFRELRGKVRSIISTRFAVHAGDYNANLATLQSSGLPGVHPFQPGWLDHVGAKGATVLSVVALPSKHGSDHTPLYATISK